MACQRMKEDEGKAMKIFATCNLLEVILSTALYTHALKLYTKYIKFFVLTSHQPEDDNVQ